MVSEKLFRHCYPDHRYNGTLAFYNWIRHHLRPDMCVLNLGAGPATRNPVRSLRGEVARVVGADPDPIVMTNDEVDEAVVIEGQALPFQSDSFDLAFSDYVLEHVEHPLPFLIEVCRVLRPGAAFFVRTPNRWHYVGVIARATPHWVHRHVANRVRGLPHEAHEPWRTFYRMNTARQIRKVSQAARLTVSEVRMFEAQPSYLVFNSIAFLSGVAYERTVNRWQGLASLRANIFAKLLK